LWQNMYPPINHPVRGKTSEVGCLEVGDPKGEFS
jgi:hypothetical protein